MGKSPRDKLPSFQIWAKADLLSQGTKVGMDVAGSSSPDQLIIGNRKVLKCTIPHSLAPLPPYIPLPPLRLGPAHLPAPHHGSDVVCPGVRQPVKAAV